MVLNVYEGCLIFALDGWYSRQLADGAVVSDVSYSSARGHRP